MKSHGIEMKSGQWLGSPWLALVRFLLHGCIAVHSATTSKMEIYSIGMQLRVMSM